MVDTASLLRAQLAHARLCPASEHPELPPATATALPTRPQSLRVTRRLQPKSTSAFPLFLLVLFFGRFPIQSVLCHPRGVSCLPDRLASLASHPPSPLALPRLLAQALGSTSAQLSSAPLRRVGPPREPHQAQQRYTNHIHLLCILIQPPSAVFTTSAVVQGIRDDASYQGGLVHQCLLRLALPTSISFPYIPCCHCARRAAASSGTEHPILEPTPNPWEVIAPTLDAPGQPLKRPPSLARE